MAGGLGCYEEGRSVRISFELPLTKKTFYFRLDRAGFYFSFGKDVGAGFVIYGRF